MDYLYYAIYKSAFNVLKCFERVKYWETLKLSAI